MLAAIGHPPHLAGICPIVTASNYHENWTYQGGAFEQWFNESWTAGLAQDTLNRAIRRDTNALIGSHRPASHPVSRSSTSRRREPAPPSPQTLAPYFLDWAAHTDLRQLLEAVVHRRKLPEHPGARAHHRRLVRHLPGRLAAQLHRPQSDHAGNPAARAGQHLLVTIGGHAGGGSHIGTVDFGPAAAEFDENTDDPRVVRLPLPRQAERLRRPTPSRSSSWAKTSGAFEDAWPLERAKATRYLLHAIGKANSFSGDGILFTKSARTFRTVPTPSPTIPPTPSPPPAARSAAIRSIFPPARAIRKK